MQTVMCNKNSGTESIMFVATKVNFNNGPFFMDQVQGGKSLNF